MAARLAFDCLPSGFWDHMKHKSWISNQCCANIFIQTCLKTLMFFKIWRKKLKFKNDHQKLCHASKNSMKTTSDVGVYDAKKIILIFFLVMKIFAFEVRGVY